MCSSQNMVLIPILLIVACYANVIDIDAGKCRMQAVSYDCYQDQLTVHITYSSNNGNIRFMTFNSDSTCSVAHVVYDYFTKSGNYLSGNLIGTVVPGIFCSQLCNLNLLESTDITYSLSYDCRSSKPPPEPIIQTVNSCPIDWMIILEITIPCLFAAILMICIIRYYYNHKRQNAEFVRFEQQTQLTAV